IGTSAPVGVTWTARSFLTFSARSSRIFTDVSLDMAVHDRKPSVVRQVVEQLGILGKPSLLFLLVGHDAPPPHRPFLEPPPVLQQSKGAQSLLAARRDVVLPRPTISV